MVILPCFVILIFSQHMYCKYLQTMSFYGGYLARVWLFSTYRATTPQESLMTQFLWVFSLPIKDRALRCQWRRWAQCLQYLGKLLLEIETKTNIEIVKIIWGSNSGNAVLMQKYSRQYKWQLIAPTIWSLFIHIWISTLIIIFPIPDTKKHSIVLCC